MSQRHMDLLNELIVGHSLPMAKVTVTEVLRVFLAVESERTSQVDVSERAGTKPGNINKVINKKENRQVLAEWLDGLAGEQGSASRLFKLLGKLAEAME